MNLQHFFLILICLFFASAQADTIDRHNKVQLEYQTKGKISGMSYKATSMLIWQPNKDLYNLNLSTRIFGIYSVAQHSQGSLNATGLHPTKYLESKKKYATFDYKKQEIIFSQSGYQSTKLLPLAQDRISTIIQIGYLLQQNPQKYGKNINISFQVASPRRAPIWTFTVSGNEKIKVLNRNIETIIVEKTSSNDENKDKIKIWLAPELGYFPVKIDFFKTNGDQTEQQLKSISQ